MSNSQQICYLPATELVRFIRAGEMSPIEIVDAVLEQIEEFNPVINAFTTVLIESARKAAKKATDASSKGESLGPLHGVPFSMKDLTPVKGIRTTYGSKAFAHHVSDFSATVAERLLAAGGILVGKTTTPELGHKGVTESPLTGITNNPWKLTHSVGGSSGGAAAAVAMGFGQLAEGSDGGGSIRIPASCCGVVGFKPSFGRIPTYGVASGFTGLLHEGIIARTLADTALMFSVLVGRDDRDPYSLEKESVDYLEGIANASIEGVKIAYSPDMNMGVVDSQVAACTAEAAMIFASDLGALVEKASPEFASFEEAMAILWNTQHGTELLDRLLSRISQDEISPSLLESLYHAQKLTAIDYYRAANGWRSEYYLKMLRFFEDYELLITPTLLTLPFPHPGSEPGPGDIEGTPINPLLGWMLTYPFNLTGQPAISVPCGFSQEGLPIGLQIVGRRHADLLVLQAAASFEKALPWANVKPSLNWES